MDFIRPHLVKPRRRVRRVRRALTSKKNEKKRSLLFSCVLAVLIVGAVFAFAYTASLYMPYSTPKSLQITDCTHARDLRYCKDNDGDGYGSLRSGVFWWRCNPVHPPVVPKNYTTSCDDCDDADPARTNFCK